MYGHNKDRHEYALLRRWRRQIVGRRTPGRRTPRALAAIGYLPSGPVLDGLIELQNLLLVVLYDKLTQKQRISILLAGYSANLVDWGVELGGIERARFLKDLRLRPTHDALGQRISLASRTLLQLALELDDQVERHRRQRSLRVWPSVRLPSLWAGFHQAAARDLSPFGPELEHMCSRTGRSADAVIEHVRREHFGLLLYPLEWVSHNVQCAVTLFADVSTWSQGHVFQLRNPAKDLVGYRGAVQFDFFSSPFGRQPWPQGRKDMMQRALAAS